jgi:hypothetical protein
MQQKISAIMLAVIVVGGAAWATCYPGVKPSSTSGCDPDSGDSQTRTTQDQAGQGGANTFCIGICTNDTAYCNFQRPATSGCTSSGTYSNVWTWTAHVTGPYNCARTTGTYYHYNYEASQPTSAGEAVKYVIDFMNCEPHP